MNTHEPVAWKDSMYCDDGNTVTREHLLLVYDNWEDLPDGTDLYASTPDITKAVQTAIKKCAQLCDDGTMVGEQYAKAIRGLL